MNARTLLILTFAAGGCFSPSYKTGMTPCAPKTDECPSGFQCRNGLCWEGDHETPDMASSADQALPGQPPPDQATSCDVLYVSPLGSDANSGCSPAKPMATIHTALAAAGTDKAVHVCRGTYSEPPLTSSVPLMGGYDCSTWDRRNDYGYPTFDTTNQTVLVGAQPTATATVVVVNGSLFDGFTVVGKVVGCSSTVEARGAAVISNDQITGGSGGCADGNGSTALSLATGTVEVTHNQLNGGNGHTTASKWGGSVAVSVSGVAAPHIHDNAIQGGSGEADVDDTCGSIGVQLIGSGKLTGSHAFEHNVIFGGTGSSNPGFTGAAMIIDGSGDLDILDNAIEGASNSKGNGAYGINALEGATGSYRIVRNRIYGGLGYGAMGVAIDGGTAVEIAQNLIESGPGRDTSWSYGVWVNRPGVVVRENTIIAEQGDHPSSFQLALHFGPYAREAIVQNNILGGSHGVNAIGIDVDPCPSNVPIAAFDHNVSFNLPDLFRKAPYTDTTCPRDYIKYGYADMAAALGASAHVAANVDIRATCSDPSCLAVAACSTPAGCLQAVFPDSWDTATEGKANLFDKGWRLGATTPCAFEAGADLSALGGDYATDILGQPRGVAGSMGKTTAIGAIEYGGACAP